jgi:hypothetical protein
LPVGSQSLYRRVLGSRFEELPDVLKRFHDSERGGRARGTLHVERGKGFLRNVAASLLGMPPAGPAVPVRLEIVVDGDREHWRRHFPGRCSSSTQWARGELLMEAFGAGSFSCVLVIDGTCLRYEFQRAWFAGVAIPSGFSPRVDGRVFAGENGWRVEVHVYAPLLGEVFHYEGWVEPE